MAKMTKTETTIEGQKHARQHPRVAGLTFEEITSMDYNARRALAASLADACALNVTFDTKYMDAYRPAFIDTAMSMWNAVTAHRERQRRQWKHLIGGMSASEAQRRLVDLITSMNIRGARFSGSGLEVERGRRVGARLYFNFNREYEKDEITTNPDDFTQRGGHYSFKTEISTSGSTWNLSDMAVIHQIEGELMAVAHELISTVSDWNIVWTTGVPEPVEVVATEEATL